MRHPDPVVIGLVGGFVADRLLGDPARLHPVAGFGRCASALEDATYRPSRPAGVAHVGALVVPVVAAGALAERMARRWWPVRAGLVAGATWTVLGGRSLEREALTIHRQLTAGDLEAARRQVRHLVGRDPSNLDASEVARASVESLAENGSDAVVAPLLWGAAAGVPGLLGYRAINTLDAMIGHRSVRYRQFGWAAARLDDVANWVPARLTVAATALAAPAVGGTFGDALRAARAPGVRQHPSPNAGPVEASVAGALGRAVGGTNVYDGVSEDRGHLGCGAPVGVEDLPRAVDLVRRVGVIALTTVVLGRLFGRASSRGRGRRCGSSVCVVD